MSEPFFKILTSSKMMTRLWKQDNHKSQPSHHRSGCCFQILTAVSIVQHYILLNFLFHKPIINFAKSYLMLWLITWQASLTYLSPCILLHMNLSACTIHRGSISSIRWFSWLASMASGKKKARKMFHNEINIKSHLIFFWTLQYYVVVYKPCSFRIFTRLNLFSK